MALGGVGDVAGEQDVAGVVVSDHVDVGAVGSHGQFGSVEGRTGGRRRHMPSRSSAWAENRQTQRCGDAVSDGDEYNRPAAAATIPTIVTHAPGPIPYSTPSLKRVPENALTSRLAAYATHPK